MNAAVLKGPTFGQREVHPTECLSGEQHVFLGADLLDQQTDLDIRFVLDPLESAAVRIFAASNESGASMVLRPSQCKVFRYDFDHTGS